MSTTLESSVAGDEKLVSERIDQLLAEHDPKQTDATTFLGAGWSLDPNSVAATWSRPVAGVLTYRLESITADQMVLGMSDGTRETWTLAPAE